MNKTILKFVKNLYYHSISFSISLCIFKSLLTYIDIIYIHAISFMIFIWILNDSYIINNDFNLLEFKYNDLLKKYDQLYIDFNNNLKEKFNQTNLICETLAQHTLVIIDIKNELINLKNIYKTNSGVSSLEISPLLTYDEPIKNAKKFNDYHCLNKYKMQGKLQEYFSSKSCIF